LTLPHYQDFPSKAPQFLLISQVPFPVLGKFFGPELLSGFRLSATPGVLVPETAVHKDNLAKPGKNQVGFAGKIADVETIAEAHPVHEPTNYHLRLRILASHAGHPLASFLLREVVH